MAGNSEGRGCLMILGILCVIAGIIAICSPLMTGSFVIGVIGAMLMIVGIMELVNAFTAGGWKLGVLAFIGGALAILAGGALIANPVIGSKVVTIMLIVFFMVDGITRSIVALKLKPLSGWSWQLVGGIVTIILGALIWKGWPLSGNWAIGVLVGIRILFTGIGILFLGSAASAVAKEVEKAVAPEAQ